MANVILQQPNLAMTGDETPRLFGRADVDTTQIVSGLTTQFEREKHRIVFWHDPEREFTEIVDSLGLEGVTLIHLDEDAALGIKVRLERTDPTGRYLLYAPFQEPPPQDDWLLDIRLYSGTFRADRASMLLAELGLGQNQALRDHLRQRLKFLGSKERVSRLSKMVDQSDTDADVDRKMLAVLTRSDQAEPFSIVGTLLHDLGTRGGLGGTPTAWEDIAKFGLAEPFWAIVARAFGYQEDAPKLRNLLLRLLVTDLAQALTAPLPTALQHHLLPASHASSAVVFLNLWRDSATRGGSYDMLSGEAAQALQLADHLGGLSAEALAGAMTFLEVEKQVARELRDRIASSPDGSQSDGTRALIVQRQDGHWASPNLPATVEVPRRAFHAVYDALLAATELLALAAENASLAYPTAEALYSAYERELCRLDQTYRHFCEADDSARAESWDILKVLRDRVESVYGQGFLVTLGLRWGEFLERGLLQSWRLADVPPQHRFFDTHVKPVLARSENQKVFVIISDAFRYEAARELAAELNGKYRFHAELSSQLGVLPSYTPLGMAALLPHRTLAYNAKGDVLADDQSTAGLESRSKILDGVGGMAVAADVLLRMKREEGRTFLRDCRVVYIYHNQVDATGDDAATEADTFQAVRRAIDEIAALTRHIINSLNGSYVIVTADHGFLFQETPPSAPDKSTLEDRPEGTLVAKKRYLLGRDLPPTDKAYLGATAVTAQAGGDVEFWVPKGTNRFHFSGGARFLHGGAMPQEVIVPVITVREKEDEAAEATRTRPVAVHVLGTNIKVTTARCRFQLLQTEAVTERVRPVTLQVALYQGEAPISNVETVTFDTVSGDMAERTKWVTLALRGQDYDRKAPYALVLRGADDSIEYGRVAVTIDLAFGNDF